VVTYGLIVLNALFFLIELNRGEAFIVRWAFVPTRFLADPVGDFPTLFTSMFMHAGWVHLIGNMLYLWIFGDNVEDRFGQGNYLIFYLLCGFGATFTQLMFSENSSIPNLGASGAIAGVLGAYILMFPQARVRVLMGRMIVPMSALGSFGVFVLQLFSDLPDHRRDTVGWSGVLAHVGACLGLVLRMVSGGNRLLTEAMDSWHPPTAQTPPNQTWRR
jgi:membrane associated rhomboid family serine protease